MGERSEHPPAPLGYSIDLLFSQENLLFLFPVFFLYYHFFVFILKIFSAIAL